jgi:hypothetical protein
MVTNDENEDVVWVRQDNGQRRATRATATRVDVQALRLRMESARHESSALLESEVQITVLEQAPQERHLDGASLAVAPEVRGRAAGARTDSLTDTACDLNRTKHLLTPIR